MQIRLIYASKATKAITESEVRDILATATRRNAENNITGMLCYSQDYFLQCLEGERMCVNFLYDSIIRDNRHTELFLIEYCEADMRVFKEWSMVGIDLKDENTEFLLKKYMPNGFQPQNLTAEQALDMIEILGTYLKGKNIK